MNHLKHITQATLLIDQIPTGPFSSTIMLRVGSSNVILLCSRLQVL